MEKSAYATAITIVLILAASACVASYFAGKRKAESALNGYIDAIECEARKQGCLMAISEETDLKLECLKLTLKNCQ